MSAVAPPAFTFTDGWRRWIAENLLLGVADQSILNVLVAHGMTAQQAEAHIDLVRGDACLAAGWQMTQRLRKLESTLDALQRMRRLDNASAEVPRRSGMSGDQFLAQHYAANRPVVLTDLTERWPARMAWTPDYLKQAVGDEVVEVMTGREEDDQYEVNLEAHRTSMRFSDYVDLVMSKKETNDFYLVANNHFLDHPGTFALWADFDCDTRILDPVAAPRHVFFWFGPKGTVTPLHHDVSNILLVQVRGTKKVTLVPASESHRVYNNLGVYSQVDAEFPDAAKYPKFMDATRLTIELRETEALFIPVGWWHHVRSLDACISLSFTNFTYPNEFTWSMPSIGR